MKKLLTLIIGLIIPLTSVSAADCANETEWAIIPSCFADNFREGEFTTQDIVDFGFHIIKLLIDFAGVVALILIMVGGYKYVIGSFTDDKESGKNTLKYALVGFSVAVLSWVIVEFIHGFFTK